MITSAQKTWPASLGASSPYIDKDAAAVYA